MKVVKSIAEFSNNGQSRRSKNGRDSNYRMINKNKNQEVDVTGSNDSKNCNDWMTIKK